MPTKSLAQELTEFRTEHMLACSFCSRSRKPDPHLVIVSTESTDSGPAICEVCLRGATACAAREYRRLTEAKRTPPQGPKRPTDPNRKRSIRYQ